VTSPCLGSTRSRRKTRPPGCTSRSRTSTPNAAADVELSVAGIRAKAAAGETLTAPKVDSVNSFDAPGTVVPRPVSATARDGKITLRLEPKSVTVIAVE
jgi:alpha-N-arabinofuranosidase